MNIIFYITIIKNDSIANIRNLSKFFINYHILSIQALSSHGRLFTTLSIR